MKNKVIRVFLIALVLAVWGAVIQRAFVRPEVPQDLPLALPLAIVQPAVSDTTVPRYVLARDPFLDGVSPVTIRTGNAPQRVARAAIAAPAAGVRPASAAWPSITINGILRATDGGQFIATATINGKGHV